MATATAYFGVDMDNADFLTTGATIATSTHLRFVDGVDQDDYYGNGITYDNNGFITAGTFTEYEYRDSGTLQAEIIGNVDAVTGQSFLLASDFQGLLGLIFSGADTLNGSSQNDTINSYSGDDMLLGNGGGDKINGGVGADTMLGGSGSDTYIVDNVGDKVYETTLVGGTINAGGNDLVQSSVTFKITGYIEKLTLTGNVVINGTGNNLANIITGNGAANTLSGLNGADTLNGAGGNDLLNGGTGNDSLTGGTGLDKFRFDTVPTANIDTITDFSVADDAIQLQNSIFTVLTVTGTLAAGNFRANLSGTAMDSNDYVVYETDTGKLFYDADGSGAGLAVQIATLVGLPVLTSADFLVI